MEAWNKELLRYFDANHVFRKCVNTQYEGQIKGKGDTIHVRKLGRLTIGSYQRNQTVTYQDMTSTKITITIDQQKTWAIKIDDLDDADMDISILPAYARDGGYQIADTIDGYLEDLMVAGADSDNALGSLTTPIALTQDNIYPYLVQFREKFVKAKVLQGGKNPFIVVPPEFMTLVRLCPELVEKSTSKGDEFVRAGDVVMRFAGFDIIQSTNIAADTNSKFQLVAGTNLGCTFGMKVNKIQKIDVLHDYFAKAVRALYYYGGQVIYPECLGVLTCTCTVAS